MRNIDVGTNHGQVADTIENYTNGPALLPPHDHPNARQCPQCYEVTWRYTQYCLWCGIDLFAQDELDREQRVRQRRTRVMLSSLAVSLACLAAAMYGPDEYKIVFGGVGLFALFISVAATK